MDFVACDHIERVPVRFALLRIVYAFVGRLCGRSFAVGCIILMSLTQGCRFGTTDALPVDYTATFADYRSEGEGKTVEVIRLSRSGLSYVFARYSVDRDCPDFVDKRPACGRVILGFDSLVSVGHFDVDEHLRTFRDRWFAGLMELDPFTSAAEGSSNQQSPLMAQTSIDATWSDGKRRSVTIRDLEYHPFRQNTPTGKIFAYMRGLKAHVSFYDEPWNTRAIAEQLNSGLIKESPFAEVFRKASLLTLWRMDSREAFPVVQRALLGESNSEVRSMMSFILADWARGTPLRSRSRGRIK